VADSRAIVADQEADARYLARVADDVEPLLGPGEIVEMAVVRERRRVAILCRHAFGGVEMVSEGRGSTLVAAHANLRSRLVEDRVGIGLRALVAGR
jgi:hypothetical protein